MRKREMAIGLPIFFFHLKLSVEVEVFSIDRPNHKALKHAWTRHQPLHLLLLCCYYYIS